MSRWGNFLQGIESGLDKILAEDGQETKQGPSQDKETKSQTPSSQSVSRQGSGRKKPDRLQQRLAKAVDGSNSETRRSQSGRTSIESTREPSSKLAVGESLNGDEDGATARDNNSQDDQGEESQDVTNNEPRQGTGIVEKSDLDAADNAVVDTKVPDLEHAEDEPLEKDSLDESYLMERIEGLQAKLDVYIKEAADRSQDTNGNGGTADAQKVVDLEQRVAGLMAEGEALSRKELKHLSAIRRLNGRINDTNASLSKEKGVSSNLERNIQALEIKIERLETAQEDSATQDKNKELIEQLELVRKQNAAQANEISQLRKDSEKLKSLGSQNSLENLKRDFEKERRTNSDLKDEIESLKIEKELELGRIKSQLEEARRKSEQDKAKLLSQEAEAHDEIKILERRLEAMRSRNEEASGGTSDGQAKQLRQIEALQRQHSVSKENWNGIEASLNSRIASLESERDELLRKETDLRRKLRDLTSTLRKKEDGMDELRSQTQLLEDSLQEKQTENKAVNDALQNLRTDLVARTAECDQLKNDLKDAQASLANHAEIPDPDFVRVSDPLSNAFDRSASPLSQRKPNMAFEARDRKAMANWGLSLAGSTSLEQPSSSRKVSVVSPQISSHFTFRQQPAASITRSSSRSAMREANALSVDEDADRIDSLMTPATPNRAFGDVLSVSATTPAAGPSVQLVERMSSAVRRLESEKASTKDELERMSSERDEARKQVISLVEEVELKRGLDSKVTELEKEVKETAQRYQTTLELLGEKSEEVEELKADIADMKQIYREALEKSLH